MDDWPDAWADAEQDALEHIAALREQGADCAERGKFGPAPALRRHPALDCAARFHAQDMAEHDYLGRLDPDGRDEQARVRDAGYSAAVVVQHIAAGPVDGEELVDLAWRPRPVPCSSLVSSELSEVGVGFIADSQIRYGTAWVVVLATPGEPVAE